ncbi:MAG: hypothetical protein HZA54_14745 [Planctomycetes bacterium]|nr:hypothetical protein [Planctomycetota bacterium]
MCCEFGCSGMVALGTLGRVTRTRLAALTGVWLEFEPEASRIVVRVCSPSGPECLPAVAAELVGMLGTLTPAERNAAPGGELHAHVDGGDQLARLRVLPGAIVTIDWSHPDFGRARRIPYSAEERIVLPEMQRLNGMVSFVAAATGDLERCAHELQALAGSFEGLYPGGELRLAADAPGDRVEVTLDDLNLDVARLVARLRLLARAGSLVGHVDVTSFGPAEPEEMARIVFDADRVWLDRPALWDEALVVPAAAAAQHPASAR